MDLSKPYRPLVTQVDADGNEIAGIRLPDIAVPLGTYTGWNLYKAPFPEGELCDRDGTYAPFAATRAEREAKNDPRPSLEERYGDHAGYVRRVEQAVKKLVAERLLLAEDGELFVARAKSEETVEALRALSAKARLSPNSETEKFRESAGCRMRAASRRHTATFAFPSRAPAITLAG